MHCGKNLGRVFGIGFRKRPVRALVALPTTLIISVFFALLHPVSGQAKTPVGTGITASKTAIGHLTATYTWTIDKSVDPASQSVAIGSSATVTWKITLTRSASGTVDAFMDGSVCVKNTGGVPTQGLAISDQVVKPPSSTVLNAVAVDVSAKPTLNAGQSFCYPYKTEIPSAMIVPGATYKDTAHVTITNQAGSPGLPSGPSPSATVILPTNATGIDSSITVTDTNGRSFNFSASGDQSYDQTIACATADGAHTISNDNTATIQSTGQTSKATATVHCATPTTTSSIVFADFVGTTVSAKGQTVQEEATVSPVQTGTRGTFTYKVYDNADCSGTPLSDATPSSNTLIDGEIDTGSNTAFLPVSNSVGFDTAGTYYWQASYSGDPDHNTLGSKSDCTSGKLTVVAPHWLNGDLTSYDQFGWDTNATASTLLTNNFTNVYGGGSLFIGGDPYFLAFTSGSAILDYMISTGAAGPLTSNREDPTDTASGTFGGDVLALQLDVDFADAGKLSAGSGLKFGDLTICGLTSDPQDHKSVAALNGTSVRDLLAIDNALLGGGSSGGFTAGDILGLDDVTGEAAGGVSGAFEGGTPSTFAQAHLVHGSCP